MKDYQSAVADFTQAISINPHLAEAYGNRGNTRRQMGDLQGAVSDLHKAADLFKQQGRSVDYEKALELLNTF